MARRLAVPRGPQFDKDLALLTEMAAVSEGEAVQRAVHLASELMTVQRNGGHVELVWPATTPLGAKRRERIRFDF